MLGEEAVNYRNTLVKRLANLRSCYVLDAGTGAGTMTGALSANLKASIVSVDRNRRVFPDVHDRVDRSRVDFVACDFTCLPFMDAAFCGTICDLVLSTTTNLNVRQVLTEFNRTLRAKSALYVTDYYPEERPRNRRARSAAATWKLHREVLERKGITRKETPPKLITQLLYKAGFHNARCERIAANEELEWKTRVFAEYYSGVKYLISTLNSPEARRTLRNKLEEIKDEIEVHGKPVNWGWGANYIIHAR
jgi:ubiquinone/menaquinone biosynthesis C-methylase UbiE